MLFAMPCCRHDADMMRFSPIRHYFLFAAPRWHIAAYFRHFLRYVLIDAPLMMRKDYLMPMMPLLRRHSAALPALSPRC